MNMCDRKQLILQAIIEDYINTAEPVGSRTISKKYLIGVSPATIRNEMADLEEMGYIEQPHTSAGRIPSDKGYRLYVDQLIDKDRANEIHNELMKKQFFETLDEIDKLVKHASRLLSQLTQYTSIATTPQLKMHSLKCIQLIKIDVALLLAVIITDAGIAKNSVIITINDVTTDIIVKLNNIFNAKLSGLSASDINETVICEIIKEANGYMEIIQKVMAELIKTLNYSDSIDLYCEGAANILDLPEYRDVKKARDFFNVLEEKELLFNLLSEASDDVSVTIGRENTNDRLSDCSLITATYKLNGKTVGSIGVVGPTRMDYTKVISIVDCIKDNMTQILNNFFTR